MKKIFVFTLLLHACIFWNECAATLLKNKEIEQLQQDVDGLRTSMMSLDEKITRVDRSHISMTAAANKKVGDLINTIEMLQSRMIASELKIQLLEQPGTPGSPVRRPAYRRNPSSNNARQGLSPNPRNDVTDYFQPSSPYSS